jgi:uncharacterized protein (TIGR04222 family)
MGGPFTRIFDFFPFNVDSGPKFLAIYLGIAIVGLWLAKAAQARVVRRREEATKAALAVKEQPAGYRISAAIPWAHRPLTVGFMPMREEHLCIAYLKGGTAGVASALVASAVAHGWLVTDPDGSFRIGSPERGALADEQALFKRLNTVNPDAASASSVLEAAHKVARRSESSYEDNLLRAGLLRTQATRTAGRWTVLLIGAAILGIGAVRALRGVELGRSIGYLIIEMIGVCGALFLVSRVDRITTAGKAYLEWIDAATTTLRADVRAGRDQVPADVLLAASLAGMFVLPELARAAAVAPDAFRGHAVASASVVSNASSSDYSSPNCSSASCSSSSCGGGGGCGGSSGCGGGGGCGG